MKHVCLRVGKTLLVLFVTAAAAGCTDDSPTEPTPKPQACEYSAAPAAFTPCMSDTGELTFTVSTQNQCAWTVTATVPWITLTAPTSGSSAGVVRFRVPENWDAPREGLVLLRGLLPGQGQDVRVSQAGCLYWVSREQFGFDPSGGSGTFEVFQQSEPNTCGGPLQDACRWSAVSNASWIVITTTMPRTGDDTVFFVVQPNQSATARTGTITVRSLTVQITQTGS